MAEGVRIVVFASQKGGSGKTTLSGHIAVEAERTGDGPVALIDTDPQGSLAKWWNARAASTPAFAHTKLEDLDACLDHLKSLGFKLIVVDTPPAVTQTIAHVVARADLVVVPTRPSPHDLRAVGPTVDIAESLKKPLIFVVNSATARARITSETAVALSARCGAGAVTLHHRVDYAALDDDGRTARDPPRPKSARNSGPGYTCATVWPALGPDPRWGELTRMTSRPRSHLGPAFERTKARTLGAITAWRTLPPGWQCRIRARRSPNHSGRHSPQDPRSAAAHAMAAPPERSPRT
jgi:cellulose biosynthesis protein BcsQ